MAPVRLTREDWTEIYYAVQTKLERLLDGEYLDPDIPAERQRQHQLAWAAQLTRLLDIIGQDGKAAASGGVVPAASDRRLSGPWQSSERFTVLSHSTQQRQGDAACS